MRILKFNAILVKFMRTSEREPTTLWTKGILGNCGGAGNAVLVLFQLKEEIKIL